MQVRGRGGGGVGAAILLDNCTCKTKLQKDQNLDEELQV